MERRVLLAISLSFLVLFLFQRFVLPQPEPAPAGVTTAAGATSATGGNVAGAPTATAAAAQSAAGTQARQAPAVASTVTESSAREIIVETTKVKAVFSNRGATLQHWILKEYRNDVGQPLDLVPQGAGPNAVKPFSITVD